MREVDLKMWAERGRQVDRKYRERKVKRRPTPRWKLIDSIKYIKMRDRYLQRENILVRKGEREWELNL